VDRLFMIAWRYCASSGAGISQIEIKNN